MMVKIIELFLNGISLFFLVYLILYTTYLFISVLVGALKLYKEEQKCLIRNQIKHEYYVPVSILVPAYNEEVTIVDSIQSLLRLDYQLYEIIIINDGSSDQTVAKLLQAFPFHHVNRPIHRVLSCQQEKQIYEAKVGHVEMTLIDKINGGKGDSLNMGINVSRYPYFLCIDADSLLQKDSLEKIVRPVLENDQVVAVGGMIRVAQCVEIKDGEIVGYQLPFHFITSMQVVEYDRSFLASRILMDQYNGNLIISGAFGLFKKDVAIAAGGYDQTTLGEDMELVVKLHVFCRNNQRPYLICYEPNAVCWSQVPSTLRDLMKQRRRWYLGLFQVMTSYSHIFLNFRFGLVSFFSYMYYLLFELLAPMVEVLGILTVLIAGLFGLLNVPFMIRFLMLYMLYGIVLTITAFFQRIYTQHLKVSIMDMIKAIMMCIFEGVFLRYVLSFVRVSAFFGYHHKKNNWGSIKRVKQGEFH